MRPQSTGGLGRRDFLLGGCAAALALGGLGARALMAAGAEPSPKNEDDTPNTHNWLVLGESTVFLSHLPMFDGGFVDEKTKAPLRSPHHFQVILEATFATAGRDVGALYARDRRAHPGTSMYTLMPNPTFVLRDLFPAGPGRAPIKSSFTGSVFRGHLERGGKVIPGLDAVTVNVTRVVHAEKFDPAAAAPPELEYLLFGRGAERFLAHRIVSPPDFDQLLSVEVGGRELTDATLARGVRVRIPGRTNRPASRIAAREQLVGMLQTAPGAADPAGRVDLKAGVEFYFEDGELRAPATFAQTSAERKAGF